MPVPENEEPSKSLPVALQSLCYKVLVAVAALAKCLCLCLAVLGLGRGCVQRGGEGRGAWAGSGQGPERPHCVMYVACIVRLCMCFT